ncbi:hypothetical protein R1sor_000970 [Riccia sorocarpa]|uniref:Uncharacterized protein n=1 Tax=Riccia sorocarpa TaxID=122646 RepID=A0ABD3GUY6_9MARC
MSSESGGSKPPVQEIISSSSTGTPTRSYFLNNLFKLQHLPTHFVHTLFAKFRALVLPLRYIRPPSPPRSPGRNFRRHALYVRDGVFVPHTREAPPGGAQAPPDRRCCQQLRSCGARCWECLDSKCLFIVGFLMVMAMVLNYVRWMIWKDREAKTGDYTGYLHSFGTPSMPTKENLYFIETNFHISDKLSN